MTRTITMPVDGDPLDFEVEAMFDHDGECWELLDVLLDGVSVRDRLTDAESDFLIAELNRMDDSSEWTDEYDYVDEYAEANHSFWSRL